ncbi:NUDIX domain-containing protein [Rappaport israeli]|uniref:NUDIX domain-containing protein n=1 Tax=Rappaport israeli TaxID=1839807 RepID=UPI0009308C8B|nr:NUDIX domain-containing protein [Rappaport israeli]
MHYQFRVLDAHDVYQGFFKLKRYEVDFELFRGGFSGKVVRECSGASGYVVAALPYDPELEEFVFIEQFRIGAMVAGVNPWQQEIVAGFMDKQGETPQECIQRELQEEIGTQALELELVETYFNAPGGSSGRTHLFFARVDAKKVGQYTGLLEEGEDILVRRVSYQQAFSQLVRGEISNVTMLLALQAFLLHKHYPNALTPWQS